MWKTARSAANLICFGSIGTESQVSTRSLLSWSELPKGIQGWCLSLLRLIIYAPYAQPRKS